jgi:SAM-dependent methyltransferase
MEMTAADYDRFAPFYDLEFGTYEDDLPLYRAFAAHAGGPILELGCGTGRALIPLAADGYRVTGVDLSPAMLALAHSAAQAQGLAGRISLVEQDIRTLTGLLDNHFTLAFSAINSFLHLETQEDQIAALSAAARCLQPGGIFIADLFPPHPDILIEYDGRLVHAGTFRDEGSGERIDKFSSSTLDQAEQQIDTTFFYDRQRPDGTVVRTAASFVLRYVGRHEFTLLLERAGFTNINFYGSYDLEPFTSASERMIAVATRPS